jgi:hypothetical protein
MGNAMKQTLLIFSAVVAASVFCSDASFAGGLGRDATHGMRRIGPRTPAAQSNPSDQMRAAISKKKKQRM